ncbi:MAG: bifunctional aspartate kinase/homoserine dehydrogenase I, partial [Arachidicoccus sp.]
MRVFKFGGSSVANADNIKKVAAIVAAAQEGKKIIVVSAMSGVTNQLLHIGNTASNADENYKSLLQSLLNHHLNEAKRLVPVTTQSACLSGIMQLFNEIEEIADSVCHLKEFSPATKDRILSFGEILSSKIISAHFQSIGLKHSWLDSSELILTNSKFGAAEVKFAETNKLIKEKLNDSQEDIFLVPGFIAKNKKN